MYIAKKLTDDLFISFVLRISLENIIYKEYVNKEGKNYISDEYFRGKNLQMKEFAVRNFIKHFCG